MPLTVTRDDWDLLEELDAWLAAGRVAFDFGRAKGIKPNALTDFQRRFGLQGKRNVGLMSIITREPFKALVEQGLFEKAPADASAVEETPD